MKAKIESTNQIVTIADSGEMKVKARVWEGISENGVPFVLYVAYMQVHRREDNAEFERDLEEHKAPQLATLKAINARMIL